MESVTSPSARHICTELIYSLLIISNYRRVNKQKSVIVIIWHQFFAWIAAKISSKYKIHELFNHQNIYVNLVTIITSQKKKRQSETRVLTLYKEFAMKFANISVVLYDKCFLPAFMQSALCFFSISLGEWRIEEIGERADERMRGWAT